MRRQFVCEAGDRGDRGDRHTRELVYVFVRQAAQRYHRQWANLSESTKSRHAQCSSAGVRIGWEDRPEQYRIGV